MTIKQIDHSDGRVRATDWFARGIRSAAISEDLSWTACDKKPRTQTGDESKGYRLKFTTDDEMAALW